MPTCREGSDDVIHAAGTHARCRAPQRPRRVPCLRRNASGPGCPSASGDATVDRGAACRRARVLGSGADGRRRIARRRHRADPTGPRRRGRERLPILLPGGARPHASGAGDGGRTRARRRLSIARPGQRRRWLGLPRPGRRSPQRRHARRPRLPARPLPTRRFPGAPERTTRTRERVQVDSIDLALSAALPARPIARLRPITTRS